MKKTSTTGTPNEAGVIVTSLYNGKIECKFMGPTEDKPSRHIYMMNGERKRSVTGIQGIKDKSMALVPWALEMAAASLLKDLEEGKVLSAEEICKAVFASQDYTKRAGDIGSAVHDWCEHYINHKLGKNPMPEMPEDNNVVKGITSFLEWESQHKVKFLWAEKVLYSRKGDYMGKADFAAKVDGDKCICDLKTGNGMYKEVRLQLAAYRAADEEETGEKYDGRWAIQIGKETPQEYQARFELKNKIKRLLGKKESEVYPYQVLNAKYLDVDEDSYNKDLAAFLHLAGVHKWDAETTL